jgi:serine/threonine-protein kinase RsbW
MAQTHIGTPLPYRSADMSFVELHQSFPSDLHCVSAVVGKLMHFIAKSRSRDGSESDIEMAVREALENAIVHGNEEDPHKSVYVRCVCTSDGEVSITVQDEGPGFDADTLPDPTTPENRLRASGRGVYLMKSLMDEVRFERGGTVVHMRRKSNGRAAAKRKVH